MWVNHIAYQTITINRSALVLIRMQQNEPLSDRNDNTIIKRSLVLDRDRHNAPSNPTSNEHAHLSQAHRRIRLFLMQLGSNYRHHVHSFQLTTELR